MNIFACGENLYTDRYNPAHKRSWEKFDKYSSVRYDLYTDRLTIFLRLCDTVWKNTDRILEP